MLVKKICLSNFKNFDNIEVELDQINVIVGANAAGKSNFMQSLKFIRDIENYGIENAISLQGGIEYLRNIKLKDNNIIKLCIEILPTGGNVLHRISTDYIIGLKTKKIEYYLEILIKSKSKYEIIKEEIKYDTQIEEISLKDDSPNRDFEPLKVHNEYFFSVTSLKGKLSYFSEVPEEDFTVKLSNGKEHIVEVEDVRPFLVPFKFFQSDYDNKKTLLEQFSFLVPRSVDEFRIYDFDLKTTKKPSPITAKAQLEENGENLAIVLKNILEDRETKRKFSNLIADVLPFIKTVDVEKSQDKSLFFKVKEVFNSNTPIPSSLLSDGTISVTLIVAALFFEESQLAAFEEPEHGIHPALIAKLMQLFYESSKGKQGKQIIITTHSPEILRHTKLSDLFLVVRDMDGTTSINKPGDQEMVKAFLESELGIDQLFIQNLLDV